MKSRCYHLIFLLIIFQTGFAQQQVKLTLDSLLFADNQSQTEDRNKLERYVKIYKSYGKLGEIDKAETYVDRTIKLAEKLKLQSFIGRAYYSLGFYYQSQGHYIQAEDTYNKGIRKSQEIGDKRLYGDIYYNLGAMYASWSDFDKALSANLKAVSVYNELDNKLNAAGCYVNIADAYKSLEQYKTAITYLEQAVQVFKQSKGEEYGLALSYASIGANYFLADEKELGMSKTEKYQVALNFLDLSLGFANQLQDYSLFGTIYRTRAKILSVNGSSEQALEAFQKAIVSNKHLYNKKESALDLLALADFYIEHAQYHEATPLLTEALNIGEENHFPALQRDANLALSKTAEKQRQFTKALEYFKAYIRFRDQIFNEEKEREITRKRLQLDFLIKENDYKSRQHVMSLALQKRTLEARERKQQLELKEKEMRIEKLAFLQKQAILEKEKLQKESELERQHLNASLDRKYRDEKILKQETKAKLNRNLAIFLGLLVLGLSGAALLVYRAHRKTQQLNHLVLIQKTELEELGKVKDRILGVVSHDMRAPVNSLISFSKLLEHGNLGEEKLRAYTLSISQTLGHTSSMMENLLNWAYSQMQGFKPDLKILEISNLVQELVTAAEGDASHKHLRISFSQDSEAKAFGDLNMISLIVRNLLNNAVKFTPEGGRIDVKIQHDFHLVRLYIADTGIGLGEAQLQRFNSHNSIELGRSTAGTNREKGTGLGLTLCKTFAAMMNAQLTASPNDKQGTVFILSMPSKASAPKELKEFV
ncbi:tetratricopeptide repeat protein [Chitinophaga niastensis]|uniref:histidine kinase n=1 Tax=Chitinophaga niastensis TaxID=536980 RepID=A0A2P8HCB6_CHINA|nr:tetratricopeptide repeat protein [Chitinophaga niastensis]